MSSASPSTEGAPSFVRTFVLPALWVLVVPIFSYWFASHQLDQWSAGTRRSIEARIKAKGQVLTPQQQAGLQKFDIGQLAFQRCGTFGFFNNPRGGSKLCSTVLQFSWAKRLSFWLLLLAFLAALIVGVGLLWTKFDPNNQDRGFRLGWNTLRIFGVIHILSQGLLTVFLSFWLTAIWFKVYVVKLILIAVILAALAAYMSIKALFATSPDMFRIQGSKLPPEEAPELFDHIRKMAAEMGTEPPTNIVVGIDDNFFVTEAAFLIHEEFPSDQKPYPREQELHGRTLFISLPLVKVLEKDELDGILAHELAHFLAGDTAQMRKLNVQYRQFDSYMQHLEESFTWGVASCLIAFRAMFELITQSHSRHAEFRADANAAEITSPHSLIRSLLKTVAYSAYRHQTENELMLAMSKNDELKIAERVSRGFATFLDGKKLDETVLQEEIPHPFDSHPPIRERLTKLDPDVDPVALAETLQDAPESSWYEAIKYAEAWESRLWQAYEDQFQSQHELIRALRMRPTTPEEIAHVERFFPSIDAFDKNGERILTVSWWGLTLQDGDTISFDDVDTMEKVDGTFYGESLVIRDKGGQKHKAPLGPNGEFFLNELNERWRRHHIAAAEAEADAEADTPSSDT